MSRQLPALALGLLGLALVFGLGLRLFYPKAGKGNETAPSKEPRTVAAVDLKRYLGKWYEIATIPAWFQKDCVGGTTATYSRLEDGTIQVLNQCVTAEGQIKTAKGVAWVADKNTNAKLKVSFLPFGLKFFGGDYWIIDLDPKYQYAVVGSPARDYGWILSRAPSLELPVLEGIKARLKDQGYDFSKFKMTNQKDYPGRK